MAIFLNRLCVKFRQSSFENKAIMHGMSRVAMFLMFAKTIAAIKEMLVAYCYGTSAVVDGFLFAFNLIMWPGSVFFSVTSFVLIPYLVSLRVSQSEQESRFRSELLFVTVVVGAVASVVVGVALFGYVASGAAGLSALGQQSALVAIPWLAPTVALACLAALYSSWLMSECRHTNTFLEAMPSLCVVMALLIWIIFGFSLSLDPVPLVVGTFIGFVLQTVLLSYLSGCGFRVALPTMDSPHWQGLRRVFGVMLLAQIVMASSSLLDQFWAVRMGEGVLAVYSYAQRIIGLVLGFSAVVISRALLPVLSGVTDARLSWQIAKRWAWFLGVIGAGGAVALALLADLIVSLLLERGAFSAADTMAVSEVLVVLGVQLPFYLVGLVLVQWLGATKQQYYLFVAASFGFVLKLLCMLLLYDFNGIGIAWSNVLMYFVTTIVIYNASVNFIKKMDVSVDL